MTSTAEGGATHLDFIFAVDWEYVLQSYPSVSVWCIIKPVSGYKNTGISEYTAMTSL